MRLFRDRLDVLTLGSWHWCPPGARVVPFPHAFGSRDWDPDPMLWDNGVGEVAGHVDYKRGRRNPRYRGRNVCGGADVWRAGALYAQLGTPAADDDGVPFCCDAAPAPAGGVMADGDAAVVIGFVFFGSGGVELGGGGLSPFLGSGGVEVSGGAAAGGGILLMGSGGVEVSGGAAAGGGIIELDSGGVELSGGSSAGGGVLLIGSGGIEVSGGAAAGGGILLIGSGGAEVSGGDNSGGGIVPMGAYFGEWHFDRNELNVTDTLWATISANGGGAAHAFGIDGTFSVAVVNTGSISASGRAALALSGTNSVLTQKVTTDTSWECEFRCYIPTLSTSGQRFVVQFGWLDVFTGSPAEGVYFEYSDNLNSGNWRGQTKKTSGGAASATVNGSVPPVANTLQTLKIVVTGTSAEFFINGTSIGSTSTGVPTANTSLGFAIIKTVGTNLLTFVVDLVNLLITF